MYDGGTAFPPLFQWDGSAWVSDATYSQQDCENSSGRQVTTIRSTFTVEPTTRGLTGDLRKTTVGDCPKDTSWTVAGTRTGD